MNSFFLQPKYSLQRAHELVNVGQISEAFELLHNTISDRRFRNVHWDLVVQEEVMMKYLELAVKLDRIKLCKDGLLHYRNHCQHTMPMSSSLEKVILHFRNIAEKLVETSENNEGARSQAFKICIETYKTIIDLIRLTPKLQFIYHSTIYHAHELCKKYRFNNEFRKLCETVRAHYQAIMRLKIKTTDAAKQQEFEKLKKSELHIETMLSQLNVAAYLNSWREVKQAIDDLYELGILDYASLSSNLAPATKQLCLAAMAAYFEHLAEYYYKAGLYNMHAMSLLRWMVHIRQHYKALSNENKSTIASIVILACLAVPVKNKFTFDNFNFKDIIDRQDLYMLSSSSSTNRQKILSLAEQKGILNLAIEEVQALYYFIEGKTKWNFEVPSKAVELFQKADAVLSGLDSDELKAIWSVYKASIGELAKRYYEPIRIVLLRKQIINFSEVYEIMNLDWFKNHICSAQFLQWRVVERELILMNQDVGIDISIDAYQKIIRINSKDSNDICKSLYKKIVNVNSNLLRICIDYNQSELNTKNKEFYAEIKALMPQEVERWSTRRTKIAAMRKKMEQYYTQQNEKREELLRERTKKAKENEDAKGIQINQEIEDNKKKREEEAAKIRCATLALEKMHQIVEAINCSPNTFKIYGVPLSKITVDYLLNQIITFKNFMSAVQNQIDHLVEKQNHQNRQKHKKLDYFARAIRGKKEEKIDELIEACNKRRNEIVEKTKINEAKYREYLNEFNATIENMVPITIEWLHRNIDCESA